MICRKKGRIKFILIILSIFIEIYNYNEANLVPGILNFTLKRIRLNTLHTLPAVGLRLSNQFSKTNLFYHSSGIFAVEVHDKSCD